MTVYRIRPADGWLPAADSESFATQEEAEIEAQNRSFDNAAIAVYECEGAAPGDWEVIAIAYEGRLFYP